MIEPVCNQCGISLSSEDGICLRCRGTVQALPGVSRLRSACLYAGHGQDVLQIAKSEAGRSLARCWASLLTKGLAELWLPGTALIGVPAGKRNRRKRGFDQVAQILAHLDSPWRSSWLPDFLVRSAGRSQKELGRADRQHNLEGMIGIAAGHGVPLRAILVDDVCTTGATLSACAQVLQAAGCQQVDALTVFRD